MSNFVVKRGKPTIVKDPDAVLDYTLDLTEWLLDADDTLNTVSTFSEGVVVDSSLIVGTTVVVWISGGDPLVENSVTIRFTTVEGRTDDRTLYFTINER